MTQALAFLVELAMLAAYSYWSFVAHQNTTLRILLSVGVPALLILLWGKWLAPRAGSRLPMPWLAVAKLILYGGAALALYNAGQDITALIFGIGSLASLSLAFLTKDF